MKCFTDFRVDIDKRRVDWESKPGFTVLGKGSRSHNSVILFRIWSCLLFFGILIYYLFHNILWFSETSIRLFLIHISTYIPNIYRIRIEYREDYCFLRIDRY